MKINAKGEAADPDRIAEEQRARREQARKILEPTLPWRVNVQFINDEDEVVCEWDTGFVISNWDMTVFMRFQPLTHIEVEES